MVEGVAVVESGLLEQLEVVREGKEKLVTWAWRQYEGQNLG